MLYYFVWFLATFTNVCLNAGLVLFVLGCANDRPHIGPSRRCLFSDSHTNLYDSANCSRARLEILVSKQWHFFWVHEHVRTVLIWESLRRGAEEMRVPGGIQLIFLRNLRALHWRINCSSRKPVLQGRAKYTNSHGRQHRRLLQDDSVPARLLSNAKHRRRAVRVRGGC